MGDDGSEVRGVIWIRRRRFLWQAVKLWAQALRVHYISASLIPVLLGTVVARSEVPISGWRLLLVLVGVFCYHGGANLVNDLFDEEADRLNQHPSLFNGGSRVLANGLLSSEQLKTAAAFCYTLGTTCAFVLALTGGGWVVLLFTLAGLGCGYFYSAPPLRLAATGFGELCVGLAFGPFLVIGTAAALAGRFLPTALLVSLPVGILITAVILINEFPDFDSDRQIGKRTLVVRLGRERSICLLAFLLAITPILLFVIFAGLGASQYWVGSFLTLPLLLISSQPGFPELLAEVQAEGKVLPKHRRLIRKWLATERVEGEVWQRITDYRQRALEQLADLDLPQSALLWDYADRFFERTGKQKSTSHC